MGHVDFYPNGGRDQPGCGIADAPAVGIRGIYNLEGAAGQVGRHLLSCSHTRAIQLYIESLKKRDDNGCVFVGHACPSYEDFLLGRCFTCGGDGHCARMGYESASEKGWVDESGRKNIKFYLNTGAGPDRFCRKFLQDLAVQTVQTL